MSFDKSYPHRKDIRKPYYKSKAFDRNCLNNKSCSYCRSNKLHTFKKRELIAVEKLVDYMTKILPFYPQIECDVCGRDGAFFNDSDYLCSKCLKKYTEEKDTANNAE